MGISQGLKAIENAKINQFATKLQIVQYRVNYYYAKGQDSYKDFGTNIEDLADALKTKIQNAINSVEEFTGSTLEIADYKYYDEEKLKELGIEEISIPIIINFKTRNVIGINGVKKNGVMCYSLEELGESYNIKYEGPTDNSEPTFSLEKKINGLNATINISNITYNGAMKKGTIYFGQVTNGTTDPVTVNYWQETSSDTININKSGTYAVKVVDGLGNEAIETVKITLANAPKLAEGMTLKGNGEYDYSDDENEKWALAEKENIEYIWVPRYSYNADKNIKFLRGTLDIPTDNNVEQGYTVNSSFTIEGQEITGIWVKNTSNITQRIKNAPSIDITAEEDIIIK